MLTKIMVMLFAFGFVLDGAYASCPSKCFFLFYAFQFNWKFILRNLLEAPVCDASTFKIGQADPSAAASTIVYYQEQEIASSGFVYGGPIGQAYTNENCCLKCTQTSGCVSWILEDDQANLAGAIKGCYLLGQVQSNLKPIAKYNAGNL